MRHLLAYLISIYWENLGRCLCRQHSWSTFEQAFFCYLLSTLQIWCCSFSFLKKIILLDRQTFEEVTSQIDKRGTNYENGIQEGEKMDKNFISQNCLNMCISLASTVQHSCVVNFIFLLINTFNQNSWIHSFATFFPHSKFDVLSGFLKKIILLDRQTFGGVTSHIDKRGTSYQHEIQEGEEMDKNFTPQNYNIHVL